MKKYIFIIVLSILFFGLSFADEKAQKDPNKIFYSANAYYEKGDYAKAVEGYLRILDMGLESGDLYYNIGNGFFKLGRLGYAILCYEKAKRLIPGDSDLKANLAYAKSQEEDSYAQSIEDNFIVRMVRRPFDSLNLNRIAIVVIILYLKIVFILAIFIINPIIARKFKALFWVLFLTFLMTLFAFGLRFYNEEILKRGIVMQREADCKYEPIDKSTSYYKLHEGNEVVVLETRNGWRKIKRSDGKIAWVKKESIEEI